jgi:hypothetical protein
VSLPKKLRKFVSLDTKKRRYLVRAVYELLIARWSFSRRSVEQIVRDFQIGRPVPLAEQLGNDGRFDINCVSWAITVGGQHVPWRSDCLIQAMAAHRWLRRNGVTGEFYLGVAKQDDASMIAHAWLKAGDLTVTGGSFFQYNIIMHPEIAFDSRG